MIENPHITTDHTVIRRWFESRGGIPAALVGKNAPTEDEGVLRIYFNKKDIPKNVELISWDEFFTKFDQSNLAFLFEEKSGIDNWFYKFISRDGE